MPSTCAGPGSGNAPTCAGENPQFRDAWAQPCAFWAGADCFQALSYGYTQAEFDELLQTPRMTESPTKSHVEEPMQEHAAVASVAQRGSAAQVRQAIELQSV